MSLQDIQLTWDNFDRKLSGDFGNKCRIVGYWTGFTY